MDITHAEELAREALSQHGFDPRTELTLLTQRENTVFSLRHGADRFVLRVHRQGYHSDAALAGELAFVRALRAEGVAAPNFVSAPGGLGFCVVGTDHELGDHQVDLQYLIPNHGNFGSERDAVNGTADHEPAEFESLGSMIAGIHAATERSGYTIAVQRENWDLAGLVGDSPPWGDPLRLAELRGDDRKRVVLARAMAREILTSYGTHASRFGPIHADLTPENVLRTDTGLVPIDFDDFAAGWYLFDLATAIYFYTPHPRYATYRAALFSGYEAIRPLSAADRLAFPSVLFARGLSYLGWAADRRGEPTAEWHSGTMLPHVVALARDLTT